MNKPLYYNTTIGSDEVGVSDYFGPIIVTATYVNKTNINHLKKLNIKDSKKLSDNQIISLAPLIMKKIPYQSYILTNKKYNKLYKKYKNMNIIKVLLHNYVLTKLATKYHDYKYIVIDKFISKENYYKHLKNIKNKVTNITFVTKGEDKCLSVACSSIISRYLFIRYMNTFKLPKGANYNVDNYGIILVKKYGVRILKKTSKLNFKNTKRIKRYFS